MFSFYPISKAIIYLAISATLILSPFLVLAEPSPTEEREALEQELERLMEEMAEIEKDISKTEQEKRTLQNQIYLLNREIDKLNLQIYQSNVIIKDLGYQVQDTESSILQTSVRIVESRGKLANILQLIYEEDQKSLIEIFLSEEEISDFFDDLVALESLSSKSGEFLEDIKELKVYLEDQKDSLDQEKTDLETAVMIKALQRQQSQQKKTEQDYYLRLTESEYQEQLKQKEEVSKMAAEIRARIFELVGTSEILNFGEAYELAKQVAKITNIRPAFLLAIISQESMMHGEFGGNVGQCYLKDPETGAGVVIYNGREVSRVMKPMGLSGRKGDVDDFLTITAELGRDPYSTPVSCPMSIGFGGAMGPAQFIPTTWMRYRDEAASITGKAADPWDIKDAFLAAALYLTDYGAAKQTYNDEWRAAMIYFSGSTKNSAFYWYANNVLDVAASYQTDIETLEEGS